MRILKISKCFKSFEICQKKKKKKTITKVITYCKQ